MRFHSSNPILRSRAVREGTYASDRPVTYANVAAKTLLLILIAGASAFYALMNIEAAFTTGWLIGAFIIALLSSILGTLLVRWSWLFGILYAISEGILLGVVSLLFETEYEGIVPTALATTVIVLLVMMLLYSMNIIKVNSRFASFLVVSMISVLVMSLIGLIFPFGGSFYYLICILTTLVACLYLFWDFENVKNCVETGADASVGWVLALGLMVSLVWIYIEVLRLLAIFGNRRR